MRTVIITAILFLTGCSNLFGEPGDRRTYYLIERPVDLQIEKFSAPRIESLVIRPVRGSALINSHKIIYSDEINTRSSYKLAQWTEPPPRRIAAIIEGVLLEQGGFSSVAPFSVTAAGDLELHIEIAEFYHDATTRPGVGVVELRAEVVSRSERKIIARTRIRKTQEIESFNSAGAVAALAAASYQAVVNLGEWLYNDVAVIEDVSEPQPD